MADVALGDLLGDAGLADLVAEGQAALDALYAALLADLAGLLNLVHLGAEGSALDGLQ